MAAQAAAILTHTARYSRAGLITMIRDEINEPIERIFSDGSQDSPTDDLDSWIDLGASVASVLACCCVAEEEVAITTTGKFEHSIDPIIFKVIGAAYIATPGASEVTYGLQKIRPQAYGGGTSAQVNTLPPKFYFIHGEGTYLKMFIIPTSQTGTDNVKIFGFARAAQHDTGQLPEEMQIAPLYYALSHVYARLGKHRLSALNMSKFIGMCNSWRLNQANAVYRVDPWSSTMIPDVTVTAQ